MAARSEQITFLEDCLKHIPGIRFRAMFGGHTVYCDDVVIGLVSEGMLFLKITEGTSALMPEGSETGPAYPGAKPSFLISDSELTDRTLMSNLITTCRNDVLAASKPRKKLIKR